MVCPFCEAVNPTAQHFLSFHGDRLKASILYHRRLASGASERAARAAANATIWHRGPGQYDRHVAA